VDPLRRFEYDVIKHDRRSVAASFYIITDLVSLTREAWLKRIGKKQAAALFFLKIREGVKDCWGLSMVRILMCVESSSFSSTWKKDDVTQTLSEGHVEECYGPFSTCPLGHVAAISLIQQRPEIEKVVQHGDDIIYKTSDRGKMHISPFLMERSADPCTGCLTDPLLRASCPRCVKAGVKDGGFGGFNPYGNGQTSSQIHNIMVGFAEEAKTMIGVVDSLEAELIAQKHLVNMLQKETDDLKGEVEKMKRVISAQNTSITALKDAGTIMRETVHEAVGAPDPRKVLETLVKRKSSQHFNKKLSYDRTTRGEGPTVQMKCRVVCGAECGPWTDWFNVFDLGEQEAAWLFLDEAEHSYVTEPQLRAELIASTQRGGSSNFSGKIPPPISKQEPARAEVGNLSTAVPSSQKEEEDAAIAAAGQNYKGMVQEFLAKRHLQSVQYNVRRVGGTDHQPEWLCEGYFYNRMMKGKSLSKSLAEQIVARQFWNWLSVKTEGDLKAPY